MSTDSSAPGSVSAERSTVSPTMTHTTPHEMRIDVAVRRSPAPVSRPARAAKVAETPICAVPEAATVRPAAKASGAQVSMVR